MPIRRFGHEQYTYEELGKWYMGFPDTISVCQCRYYHSARLRWNSIERRRGILEDALIDDVVQWSLWHYAVIRRSVHKCICQGKTLILNTDRVNLSWNLSARWEEISLFNIVDLDINLDLWWRSSPCTAYSFRSARTRDRWRSHERGAMDYKFIIFGQVCNIRSVLGVCRHRCFMNTDNPSEPKLAPQIIKSLLSCQHNEKVKIHSSMTYC